MSDMEQPSGDSEVIEVDDDLEGVEADSESGDDVELDDEQSTDSEDEELEEDIDGLKVRGKKDALEKLKAERLMQADYTRKTQEVAELRKAAETERQSVELEKQVHFQNMNEVAQIKAIEMRLSQFAQLNWDQLTDSDPVQAMRLDREARQLQAAKAQLEGSVSQRHAQFVQLQQQEAARHLEEARRVLQRDIPGWGEELRTELVKYALANGYTQRELDAMKSPAMVRSLFREYQTDKAKKQATTRPKVTQEKPVTRVQSANKTKAVTDPDKLSPEQWLKWRNSQVKKR
jgi:hypothetical protein